MCYTERMRSVSRFLTVVFFGTLAFAGAVAYVALAVSAPTNLAVTPVSSCAIELTWTDAANPDGTRYDVERNGVLYIGAATKSGGATNLVFRDKHNTSPWIYPPDSSDHFIDPGNEHAYRVRAYDPVAGAPSGYLGPLSAAALPLPLAPGLPTIVGGTSIVNGNFSFSWKTEAPLSAFFPEYGRFGVWVATSDNGSTYTGFSGPTWLDCSSESVHCDVVGDITSYTYLVGTGGEDLSYKFKIRAQEVGGDACDPERAEHAVMSSDPAAAQITVPARPRSMNAAFIESPPKIRVSWTDVQTNPNEDHIQLQRSLSEGFGVVGVDTDLPANTTVYEDTNIDVSTPTTYHYRVRACDAGKLNCSLWSVPASAATGVLSPTNFTARVVYATASAGGTADVRFTWTEETILAGSVLYLERSVSGGPYGVVGTFGESNSFRQGRYFIHEDVPFETIPYLYRLRIVAGGEANYSEPVSVNLDMRYVLRGTGWSLAQPEYGIGWIKFNSIDVSPPTANVYSVQIDNGGLMSGEAWAGEDYGWLAFHGADLAGCPSGTCEARVNLSTGEFSGWARFMNAGENWEGWDGWVKLRGTVTGDGVYGVSLASVSTPTSSVRGLAWGGEVAGWIAFNDDFCGSCTVQAVRLNEPPEVIISSVSAVDMCEVTPRILVSGSYSDEDKNPPQSVNVQFYLSESDIVAHESGLLTNGATGAGGGTMTINDSGDGVGNFTYSLPNPLGYAASAYSDTPLLRNTNYTVRIKAYDGYDETEAWAMASYATPASYYPLVDFSESADPSGRIVTFTDATDGRLSGWPSRAWQFSGATPATSAVSSPTAVFNTFVNDPDAVLKWSDGENECSLSENWTGGGSDIPGNPDAPGSVKRRIFREL